MNHHSLSPSQILAILSKHEHSSTWRGCWRFVNLTLIMDDLGLLHSLSYQTYLHYCTKLTKKAKFNGYSNIKVLYNLKEMLTPEMCILCTCNVQRHLGVTFLKFLRMSHITALNKQNWESLFQSSKYFTYICSQCVSQMKMLTDFSRLYIHVYI